MQHILHLQQHTARVPRETASNNSTREDRWAGLVDHIRLTATDSD
jgi:hypothetical protein